MFKAIGAVIILSVFIACGGAPAPSRANLQGYTVVTEHDDRAAGTLTLVVNISGPATEENVKPIVESVIANKKADYPRIIVKSYVQGTTAGTTASDPPFAVSRLENGVVTHRFNSMTESQRIQTH
jgi:hypothetical protein